MSIKRDELDQIRPFLIEKASNWSKAALEIEETDFVWHVRLGETYRGCQQPEKAREEYGKVRSLYGDLQAGSSVQSVLTLY